MIDQSLHGWVRKAALLVFGKRSSVRVSSQWAAVGRDRGLVCVFCLAAFMVAGCGAAPKSSNLGVPEGGSENASVDGREGPSPTPRCSLFTEAEVNQELSVTVTAFASRIVREDRLLFECGWSTPTAEPLADVNGLALSINGLSLEGSAYTEAKQSVAADFEPLPEVGDAYVVNRSDPRSAGIGIQVWYAAALTDEAEVQVTIAGESASRDLAVTFLKMTISRL